MGPSRCLGPSVLEEAEKYAQSQDPESGITRDFERISQRVAETVVPQVGKEIGEVMQSLFSLRSVKAPVPQFVRKFVEVVQINPAEVCQMMPHKPL